MQAGTTRNRSETHVGTWRCAGDSRGTTAPSVGALRGVGMATRHIRSAPRLRHGGSMLQKLTCQPLITSWSLPSLQSYFWGQMSTKPTWRRSPLVLWLGRRLGGGRRHETLLHQIRMHGQIRRHVSFMNASSVQIIGVKLQVSRPVWCPHPPRRPASKWTSSDEAQSLFEQMSLCPQADSFSS